MNKCIVDGCERPAHTKILCGMHYQRMRKYGNPLTKKSNYGSSRFNSSVCEIEGCAKHAATKGLCVAHYHRLLKHNDPLGGRTPNNEPLAYVDQLLCNESNDCTAWPYAHNGHAKRPCVQFNGRMVTVARVLMIKKHGDKKGMVAAHSCNNSWCVSVFHLRWATYTENRHDMHSAGNFYVPGNRKLTADQVVEIFLSTESQSAAARRYGTSASNVSAIRSGRHWSHVTTPLTRLG